MIGDAGDHFTQVGFGSNPLSLAELIKLQNAAAHPPPVKPGLVTIIETLEDWNVDGGHSSDERPAELGRDAHAKYGVMPMRL